MTAFTLALAAIFRIVFAWVICAVLRFFRRVIDLREGFVALQRLLRLDDRKRTGYAESQLALGLLGVAPHTFSASLWLP